MSSIGSTRIANDSLDYSFKSVQPSELSFDKPDNSFNINDNFKSPESYSLSKGIAAVAKIGLGVAAADIMTREMYPGQKDKRLHSLAGGLISGVTGEVTSALTDNKWLGILAGVATGVLIGAAKEYRDTKGFGTPDKNDFYATALGSATVGLTLSIPF